MKNNSISLLNTPTDLFSNTSGAAPVGSGAWRNNPVSAAQEAARQAASASAQAALFPSGVQALGFDTPVQAASTPYDPSAEARQLAAQQLAAANLQAGAPLPADTTNTTDTTGEGRGGSDNEVFTADETTDDGKILGMPKGLAIGLGIAVVAIGGFLIYKKVKKK